MSPPAARARRPPSDEELAATTVLALHIDEASAKVRTGPPGDFDHDLELPIWAGVIPLALTAGTPATESRVPASVEVPAYATGYRRPGAPEQTEGRRVDGEGEV